MSVPAQLRAALGILLVLLLGILAAAFYVPYELNASSNQKYVHDAIPLRALVEDLVIQVANQQNAVQSYLLTRDERFRERYTVAVAAGNDDLNRMVALHPSLDPLVRRVVPQISNVTGFFDSEIAAVRQQPSHRPTPGTLAQMNLAFDQVRGTANLMQQQTDRFVSAAQREQHSTYRRLLVILGVLGAITFAVGAALLLLTPRRFGQLYRAEERARREAESRADAARALEHVGDGVVLTDSGGRVRFLNPAAERLLELDGQEHVGTRLGDVLPTWAEVERRRAAGGAEAAVVPVQLGRGEHWLAVKSVDFREGVVYALRDVTEERALERMRSDFVSTASHELRTPMTSIYGAARTLLRDDIELSPERRQAFLEMIATESDRLSRIVDDILLASRLDAGGVKVSTERCDPATLTRSVLDAARMRAPGNITLELETPRELPEIAADPDRLRQVLVNMVDNAIKYSPGGGEVRVSLAANDGQVRFVVRDHGLGFPPAERERIFDRFHRLDPEQTRGIGGTGLGLYICRELVERMHGRIWAESRPGAGSSFYLELPQAVES